MVLLFFSSASWHSKTAIIFVAARQCKHQTCLWLSHNPLANPDQRLVKGVVGHNEARAAARPFHRMRSPEQELSVLPPDWGLVRSHSKEEATNGLVAQECKTAGPPPAPFQRMSVVEINYFNCSPIPPLTISLNDN